MLFSLLRIEVVQLSNDTEPLGLAFKAWGKPITKAKIKLPLYLIKHHFMRTYEGIIVELSALLISVLHETSYICFTHRKKSPEALTCVPQSPSGCCREDKYLNPRGNRTPIPEVVQPTLCPQKDCWYSFLLEAESTPGS
jgi:hypothetical protein